MAETRGNAPSGAAIYKIFTADQWARSLERDVLAWAPVDEADGFVHLSAGPQLRETANKWFAGQQGLWLVEVDPGGLAPGTLRWEPSRGGADFPHVYGDIPRTAVRRVAPLRWTGEGFDFPPWPGVS